MTLTPPENDQQRAKENHLTFEVMHREAPGERWLVAEQDIEGIEAALSVALAQETPHTCIFTSAGFRYWGSDEPELFNSSVLEHPRMVTVPHPKGFARLTWRIYPEASSRAQVERCLNDIAKVTGNTCEVLLCEPYNKIEGRFHVRFTTALGVPSFDQAHAYLQEVTEQVGEHWEHRRSEFESHEGQPLFDFNSSLRRGGRWPWLCDYADIECTNAMSVPLHLVGSGRGA